MKSSTDHSVPKLVVKTERVEQVMNVGFLNLAQKISLLWITKAAKDESH
jgi:hypothetical protein